MIYKSLDPKYVSVLIGEGRLASDYSDIADLITDELDSYLQRSGIAWPRHETASIIRKVIKKNSKPIRK